MNITRRLLGKAALGLAGATMLMQVPALAADKPAPFDKPGAVKIALVRYLSTGDFFQAYLSGVEAQAKALGVDLRVLDSRQDAALQADMVDQAIALGVQGIIIQHGLTESMKDAAQRAVDAGIKVVAFDVNVENPKIPQIEQSDRDLARLALEQAVKDNGEAGRPATSMSPASRRSTAATRPGSKSRRSMPASTKSRCSARSTTRSPTPSPIRRARCCRPIPTSR